MRPFFSFVVVLAFPTSSWATTPLLYSTSWFPFGAKKRAQSTAAGRPWSDYTMFTVTTASVQWFSIKIFLCNWYQIHLVMMFFFQNVQEMEHQINSSEMLQNLSSSLEYEKWKPMKQKVMWCISFKAGFWLFRFFFWAKA